MSAKKLLAPGKSVLKKQLPKQSVVPKRGVSTNFIGRLLDGFKQMEPVKVEIRNQ